MPVLEHKLVFREVLKYEQNVTLLEQPAEEVDCKYLVVVKVGENGHLRSEARLINRSGPLAASYTERFLRPDERTVGPTGACLDGSGKPSPDYLPVFLDRSVDLGEKWSVTEMAPDGQAVEVTYELASLQEIEPQAEIVSRKAFQDAKGKRTEVETVYGFSIKEGRVLSSHSVTEVHRGQNQLLRILVEQRLNS